MRRMNEATSEWQVVIHLTFVISALVMAYTHLIAAGHRSAAC